MDRLMLMDDQQLLRHVRRLERDVEEFGDRAAREMAMLERGDATAEAMRQRFASIRDFLARQLANVDNEVARRMAARRMRSPWAGAPLWRRLIYGSRLLAATVRLMLARRRVTRVMLRG